MITGLSNTGSNSLNTFVNGAHNSTTDSSGVLISGTKNTVTVAIMALGDHDQDVTGVKHFLHGLSLPNSKSTSCASRGEGFW